MPATETTRLAPCCAVTSSAIQPTPLFAASPQLGPATEGNVVLNIERGPPNVTIMYGPTAGRVVTIVTGNCARLARARVVMSVISVARLTSLARNLGMLMLLNQLMRLVTASLAAARVRLTPSKFRKMIRPLLHTRASMDASGVPASFVALSVVLPVASIRRYGPWDWVTPQLASDVARTQRRA